MTAPTNVTFTTGTTITSEWLNGVNDYVNELDPADHSAANVEYQPAGTGAVTTTVQTKLQEYVSVLDFGADPTGATDSSTEIQAAIDAVGAAGGGTLYFPEGNYKIASTLNIQNSGVCLIGASRNTLLTASNSSVNILKVGGISTDVFRSEVKNLGFSGGNIAIQLSYNSALTVLEDLYISQPAIGIKVAGDYTTNPINDTIINQIHRIEIEQPSQIGVYVLMCGDLYLQNIQVAGSGWVAYGIVIDSGVTAVYGSNWNCTACKGGILIADNAGISPNPTSIPSTPRQMYFYQVQGDTSQDFGIQVEEAYQLTFVDSWASGSTTGPGWVIGGGSDDIHQIALIGCRALGNSQDGFRWTQGATDLGSQMIGCHAISNGYQSSGTYDGINVQDVSGLIIQGCNSYNDTNQGLGNTQLHGINIEGDVTNVIVTGNNLDNADGNTGTNLQYDSTTHTGNILSDNIGFNNTYVAYTPSMPASTVNFVNPYARPMLVSITGGIVTAVKVDTITIATTTPVVFPLNAGHEISITYSSAPSWSWIGM